MTNSKLHIAADLDDVTLDFFGGVVIDAMYREFGVLLSKEDVLTWDDNAVKNFPWREWGYDDWFAWLKTRDWLWATAPAIPGAIAGVHALRAAGHHVECVTAKPDWAEPQVWRWLGKWRPAFQQVTLVGLDQPKSQASQADILIDDRFSTVVDWVDSAEDRLGILFDQPWNRHEVLGERMVRVHTWHGVLDTVGLMEETE